MWWRISMADERIPERLKAKVAERARHLCEYCRMPEAFSLMPRHSVDHITPVCEGGKTALSNLALACQGCNGAKTSKQTGVNPRTSGPVRLFHPRRDRWSDHFAWSEDYLRIVGLTDIGRATVETLRLNRPGVVNLRRVLILEGVHPPPEDQRRKRGRGKPA
jgi:HNH endonuclease